MPCGSCGTGADGKPAGCKSGGGCSSGGCNRLNVFNWLADIPLSEHGAPYDIVEVSFNRGSRKDFYRNVSALPLDKGQLVAVEGVSGFDVGEVSLSGELVKLQLKRRRVQQTQDLRKVLRLASGPDIEKLQSSKEREAEALVRARAIARQLNLEMKLAEVEIQADGRKATFYYTADERVDFRELIKLYASEFKVKVEMRQIGARQEAGKVGGIGSCGRELCCSTWLTDFKSVNTAAARYQNLSINQSKLSGQCGRLKCCLNYELDTYLDALKDFPEDADSIQTQQGTAYLQKRDIFRNLMWYSYPDSSKLYALSIRRVKEILELNRSGEKAGELKGEDLEPGKKQEEHEFVDVVGQISLRSLERASRKRKKKARDSRDARDSSPRSQEARTGAAQKGEAPRPNPGGSGRPPRENRDRSRGAEGSRPQQGKPRSGGPDRPRSARPRPQGGSGDRGRKNPPASGPNS